MRLQEISQRSQYPQTITPAMAQSPNGMENSLLPIDVCEAIIDTVQHTRREYGMSDSTSFEYPPEQRTLMACALTCRAWTARAQYHLRQHPQLMDSASIGCFTTAARRASSEFAASVITLRFGRLLGAFGVLVPRPGDFFTLSFPNLRALSAFNVDLTELGSVFPRLTGIRARPPLCQHITRLMLLYCQFDTVRAMLDVVWSCGNLSELYIRGCRFQRNEMAPGQAASMVQICNRLRRCVNLKFLYLHDRTFLDAEKPIPGGVFGSSLTELQVVYGVEQADLSAESLLNLVRGSFPALIQLTVDSSSNCIESLPPSLPYGSLLHGIAASLAEPRSLRKVTICSRHKDRPNCCRTLYGRSDAEESGRSLQSVLPGLTHLELELHSSSDDTDGPCVGPPTSMSSSLHVVVRRAHSEITSSTSAIPPTIERLSPPYKR
ncbi:hypothetical protein BV20DRAFT_1125399 [Pilatotrama ljubarskyi]|nr:hypothetical protein BV20DRAFT_1125399 [Pilatotrama ljubarskyi]